MGAALLIAIWLAVLGYALVYHGQAVLNGSGLSLKQALLGAA